MLHQVAESSATCAEDARRAMACDEHGAKYFQQAAWTVQSPLVQEAEQILLCVDPETARNLQVQKQNHTPRRETFRPRPHVPWDQAGVVFVLACALAEYHRTKPRHLLPSFLVLPFW